MRQTSNIAYWVIETLRRAGGAPLLVFLANKIALEAFGLGESFPTIDVPMHLLGGAAIAYFFHVGFMVGRRRKIVGSHHRATHAALVLGWTSLAAIAWELYEWFSEVYLGSPILGDVHDTLGDLVLGVLGGAVFLLANAARPNRQAH